MTGKIYFVLVSTFLMGIISGAFLYVSVFAPAYESDIEGSESIDSEAVVISGSMYGGCMEMDMCASFKLIDDRSYSYLEYAGGEVEKGKIPAELSDSLFEYIDSNALFNDSKMATSDSCDSFVDGIDYRYEVANDDEEYTLDTCGTVFVSNRAAQNLLLEVWAFMENPTTTYPTFIEEGISGVIKDLIPNVHE